MTWQLISFLVLNNIPLSGCTTDFFKSIYLLKHIGWLLPRFDSGTTKAAVNNHVPVFLWVCFIPLGKYQGVCFLGCKVRVCFVVRNHQLLDWLYHFAFPPAVSDSSVAPHPLSICCLSVFWLSATLIGVWCCLVSMCIFLMAYDVEHIFHMLMSFVLCLFKSFANF